MAHSILTNRKKGDVLLVALPTFPKGNAPLAVPYIAGILGDAFHVRAVDLNISTPDAVMSIALKYRPLMIGLSVSAQNHHIAEDLSKELKRTVPEALIVWGGEYPSLLPDQCAPHAHCVVKGMFDTVAESFINDLLHGSLLPFYEGSNNVLPTRHSVPNWSVIEWPAGYNRFMGIPLETSRGCTESCTFCMVLVMQRKHYHTRHLNAIRNDVMAIGKEFVNIIDYNFGVNEQHVLAVCNILADSNTLGFMCEMTLEQLDNERVLQALAGARCRMVYCGLETLDPVALESVGKDRTNTVAHYRRIIARAQKAGVQVASGLIIGMEHSSSESFRTALNFFTEVGVYYVKLTFLTFNPGTRSQRYYRKKGTFITEEARFYDGNHLTFLPHGLVVDEIYSSTEWFVKNFYSPLSILKRAARLHIGLMDRAAFVLFNLLYAQVYRTWLREGALRLDWDADRLLRVPHHRSIWQRLAEATLMNLWNK